MFHYILHFHCSICSIFLLHSLVGSFVHFLGWTDKPFWPPRFTGEIWENWIKIYEAHISSCLQCAAPFITSDQYKQREDSSTDKLYTIKFKEHQRVEWNQFELIYTYFKTNTIFADLVCTLCEHNLQPLRVKVQIYFKWAFVELFWAIFLVTDVRKKSNALSWKRWSLILTRLMT